MLRKCLQSEFELLEACNDLAEISPELNQLRGLTQEHIFDLDSLMVKQGAMPMTYTGLVRRVQLQSVTLIDALDQSISCYAQWSRTPDMPAEITAMFGLNLQDLLIARRHMATSKSTRATHRVRARAWLNAALVGILVVGFGSLALAADRNKEFDEAVTTRSKIALLTTTGANLSDVNVDTLSGVVTLHGTVATQADKARADKLIKRMPGAKRVRNLLQVVRVDKQPQVAAADTELKREVEQHLKEDRALIDTRIGVKSVNRGVVLLSGNASSIVEHLCAIETARDVQGVRGVESAVKTDKDAPLRKDREDDLITMGVKLRLMSNAELPALDINVDTRHGVVTLFGFVSNKEMQALAAREAAQIPGVRSVDDRLQLADGPVRKQLVVSKDEEIATRIQTELAKEPELAKMTVSVETGLVRLSGPVTSAWDRLRAANIARSVGGVRAVSVQ